MHSCHDYVEYSTARTQELFKMGLGELQRPHAESHKHYTVKLTLDDVEDATARA